MIKLEGDSIKDFNPDASIQYWFDVDRTWRAFKFEGAA